MLVDTEQLVSTKEFRKNLDKYIDAAKAGHAPFAIADDAKIVGFFVSAEEYERMFGMAVRELLSNRKSGDTISHSAVRRKIDATLDRSSNVS